MFTGIIEAVGTVASGEAGASGARVWIDAAALSLGDVKIGDSIAVSGVCLTVVARTGNKFAADVSAETLSRTSLAQARVGSAVNLEKSLRLGDRLSGHLVTGHIDGVGTVLERHDDGQSARLRIQIPPALTRFIAQKGSIAVDGVSLTVNEIVNAGFEVNIVPHTLQVTTLGASKAGTAVNLEVDLVARYVERLLQKQEQPPAAITMELLERSGFIK